MLSLGGAASSPPSSSREGFGSIDASMAEEVAGREMGESWVGMRKTGGRRGERRELVRTDRRMGH